MVLRARFRRGIDATLSGQALHSEMQERALWRPAHAVHALLSALSRQDSAPMETEGQSPQLQSLRLGHRARLLELLRLVPGARAP